MSVISLRVLTLERRREFSLLCIVLGLFNIQVFSCQKMPFTAYNDATVNPMLALPDDRGNRGIAVDNGGQGEHVGPGKSVEVILK